MPSLLLSGQGLFAERLVAHVEAALELLDPLLRRVVRRVGGTRGVVQEERLLGCQHLGVLDELQRLVGDVHREVVALLGRLGLVHHVVVVDEVGIPLVGLGPEEAVETLEPPPRRPVAPGRGQVHLGLGAQVPLTHHVGVPTPLAQDLGDVAVLGRDHPTGVGEPDGRFGDAGHGVAGVVAAGQQARPGRRAQRGGVPLGIAQPVGGDAVDVGRLDGAAVSAHGGKPDVVQDDIERRWVPPRVLWARRTVPSPAPSPGCPRSQRL